MQTYTVKIFSVNKCINFHDIQTTWIKLRRINLHFVSKRYTRTFEKDTRGGPLLPNNCGRSSTGWSCRDISPRNTFQDILFEIRRQGGEEARGVRCNASRIARPHVGWKACSWLRMHLFESWYKNLFRSLAYSLSTRRPASSCNL